MKQLKVLFLLTVLVGFGESCQKEQLSALDLTEIKNSDYSKSKIDLGVLDLKDFQGLDSRSIEDLGLRANLNFNVQEIETNLDPNYVRGFVQRGIEHSIIESAVKTTIILENEKKLFTLYVPQKNGAYRVFNSFTSEMDSFQESVIYMDVNPDGKIEANPIVAPYETVFNEEGRLINLRHSDGCQNASTVATVSGLVGSISAIGAAGTAGAIFAGALCPPCAFVGLSMAVLGTVGVIVNCH